MQFEIVLQVVACLVIVLAFRAAAVVPGLAGWQAAAAIAAMMVFIINRPHSAIVRLLEIRPLVYLRTLSYGIYVWQGILTGNGPYRQVPGWPPEPLLGAVLSVAVAALSYRFFEEPILRYKDRLSRLTRSES
jgi:peptidoglycan/LPS O-acetylase OafA/YrhL